MKLKRNDKVIILAGKDKGKTGEISKVIPGKGKVVVAGVNMVSKHVKPNNNSKGGIQKMEAPLDASNVAVLCSKCKKATTPKIKVESSGAKSRVCGKCEATIS